MIKNIISYSLIFLRKIIFLLIQIMFFVECGRFNEEIQKDARLLEAKNILDRITDKSERAKALGLSWGPDALKKSLMKLLDCTKEDFDGIFPDYDILGKQKIDKQKLKEHLFQPRILMESFSNNFLPIMEKLDKIKFPGVKKLCDTIKNSKSGVIPEGAALLISVTDALSEIFTKTDPNNSKKIFQGETCMDESGNIDISLIDEKEKEFKSVNINFGDYAPDTIGNILSKALPNYKEECYPGQTLEIMKASVVTVVSNLMGSIIDNEIELNGKKYTKMQLQKILNEEAYNLIGKEPVGKELYGRVYRDDKDKNGNPIKKLVYKTVPEILKEVMKIKLK